jgi:3-dehydroquinate dehydratase I
MEMFIRDFRVGDFPLVSGVLTDRDFRNVDLEILNAVDIIELRVDMFAVIDPVHVKNVFREVRELFNKPIIATIRDVNEGGEKAIPARLDLYRSIIPLSDIVDIEINADDIFPEIRKLSTTFRKIVIGSYHNFDLTPEAPKLDSIVAKAIGARADIVKIAVKANSRNDLLDLFSFALNNRDKRLITISMGEKGLASRIFTPLMGSPVAYGYIHSPSAPGQFSAVETMSMFKKLKIR